MFKTAIVAAVLLQASATKIESQDHNNKAINAQMVEAINVRLTSHFLLYDWFFFFFNIVNGIYLLYLKSNLM